MSVAQKVSRLRIQRETLYERLSEPLHLHLLSLGVQVFGSFRQKVNFDLIRRRQNAYGLLKAADLAKRHGRTEITAVEFGVAAGAGLMNMTKIATRVQDATGVKIHVVGFDTGTGMPPPLDYRDHPDCYFTGDFPMDYERLRAALPEDVELVIGELSQTLPEWLGRNAHRPLGYLVIDVDYYSSTVDALQILSGEPEGYLPLIVLYLDDISHDRHNSWCGELLAIAEFNQQSRWRKIEHPAFIDQGRPFKHAGWLRQMFFCHVLDHPSRQTREQNQARVLANPYL